MCLITYALLIIYARVGLTPLYIMLILFVYCWESKLLTQAGLEKLNRDLHQPSGIRYVSRSFSARCFISLAYWEGIDFYGFSVCCGTPQAIGSFLRNNMLAFQLYDILTLSLARPYSCKQWIGHGLGHLFGARHLQWYIPKQRKKSWNPWNNIDLLGQEL